jgi:hypothetical protein
MHGLSQVEEFLHDLHPDRVNGTCGMHVHLSFVETGDYALIMEPEFYGSLMRRLRDWGDSYLQPSSGVKERFLARMRGDYGYCRPLPLGTADDAMDGGRTGSVSRYMFVNFQSWEIRQTVEFRGLPMFRTAETAYAAVSAYVRLVEGYLRAQGTGKGCLSATV